MIDNVGEKCTAYSVGCHVYCNRQYTLYYTQYTFVDEILVQDLAVSFVLHLFACLDAMELGIQ